MNNLEVEDISNNFISIKDFTGQLELGKESQISHYHLAIKMKSIYTKKKVLEVLEEKLNTHINVDTKFHLENMKYYYTKKSEFILPEYSGKIYTHEWDLNFLDRKARLKKVLETFFL